MLGELSLPEYIGRIEPAGAPLQRGASAGAEIAASWLHGQQLRMESEQFNASLPLRQELMQQQAQLGQLQIDDTLRQRDLDISARQGMGKLYDTYMKNPSDVESMAGIISSYPGLVANKNAQGLMGMAFQARQMKSQLDAFERFKASQDKLTPGTTETMENPQTGEKITKKGAVPKSPEELALSKQRLQFQEDKLDYDRQNLEKQMGEISDRKTKLLIDNDATIKANMEEAKSASREISNMIAKDPENVETISRLQHRREIAIQKAQARMTEISGKSASPKMIWDATQNKLVPAQ